MEVPVNLETFGFDDVHWKEFIFYHNEQLRYNIKLPSGNILYVSPTIKYILKEMESPLLIKMGGDSNKYFIDLSKTEFDDVAIILYFFYLQSGTHFMTEQITQVLMIARLYSTNNENSVNFISILNEMVLDHIKPENDDPLKWSAEEIDNIYAYLMYLKAADSQLTEMDKQYFEILFHYYPHTIYNIHSGPEMVSGMNIKDDIKKAWLNKNTLFLKQIESKNTFKAIRTTIADTFEIVRIPSVLNCLGIKYVPELLIEIGKSVAYWYSNYHGKKADKIKTKNDRGENIEINKYTLDDIHLIMTGIRSWFERNIETIIHLIEQPGMFKPTDTVNNINKWIESCGITEEDADTIMKCFDRPMFNKCKKTVIQTDVDIARELEREMEQRANLTDSGGSSVSD